MIRGLIAVLLCSICSVSWAESYPAVTFLESDDDISIENGFVRVVLSLSDHSIKAMTADFSGNGEFDNAINVLSKPLALEVKSSHCELKLSDSNFIVASESEDSVSLELSSVFACGKIDHLTERWVISLSRGARNIVLGINGEALKYIKDVSYIGHGIYTRSASVYGLFDRGVAQMMNYDDHCLSAVDPLTRSYFVGNGTSLDVVFSSGSAANSDVVLMTNHQTVTAGLLNVVVGSVSGNGTSLNYDLAWKSCVKTLGGVEEIDVASGTKWEVQVELVPNNYDFPAYSVAEVSSQPELFSMDDLVTHMMGAYASPAGCLKSYYEDWQGTIAPTIAHPDTGYSPDTNFFDPDNYISLSALLCKFLCNFVDFSLS